MKIPLLKDHHTHPSFYATLSTCLDLHSVKNKQEALSLINKNQGELVVIRGWNSSYYKFQDEELDNLPPVLICDISLHNFLLNKPARKILSPSYKNIIDKIDDKSWTEKNLNKIFKFIASIRPCSDHTIKSFFDDLLLKHGIWYAEDMLLADNEVINCFQRTGYLQRTKVWADIETIDHLNMEERQVVHGIKLFLDGAIGANTAAIKGGFLSGDKGILIYSDKQLFTTLTTLSKFDKPVAIHAIGDLATDQAVRILTDIYNLTGHIPQIRIEHCQFISQQNAKKAKALGIILSMQPNFSSDSLQYSDRLSKEYCKYNNPFRMLIDKAGFVPGKNLIFGSDGMPHGVQFALEQSLFPAFPGQVLSVEEFINGYCMPDRANGYIQIEINEAKRTVSTKVVANS